ncbi:MAG TPA: hypothetical protein DDY78_22890 [Planctomycetales bacterium]|nr:hypothetical protein [Planctomycetales bacterium]
MLLAGCKLKRLEDEKSVMLDANIAKGVMAIPVQTKDMQVTVTATSPGAPVTLYLVATEYANEVMSDLDRKIDSPKVLAKSGAGETVTLEGTAPANKECTVVALSDKKAEVKAKIVGRY